MHDVARHAGVSVSTVSYVLSGERTVGPETRDRVMRAVEQLDYRINSVARSLKTGRTLTLGLIIPDIMNPFFTLVARGVEETAGASGYSVILCDSGGDAALEEGYLELLPSRRVDGLIYMPGTAVSHGQIRALARQGFPLIVIDESVEGIDVPSVVTRNWEGAMAMGEHLAALGHRQVDIIGGPLGLRTVKERSAGLVEALERHGVALGRVLPGDYQLDSGRTAMRALGELGSRSTAIFAANDMMAIGAMLEARSHGLRIPDDLSIGGFDDIPLASMLSPGLTTVSQPARAMGEEAAKLFLAVIQDRSSATTVTLDTHLRIRGSTSPPLAHGSEGTLS